ncbi:MAG: glycosyltransferase [Lachnospiraceae bacterium]|nr:glycosyltransferase [Lachnospiraceae bacterium]MDE6184916.1 glycosyltransferase [Lachnospiraceae bacterium]MDE7286503.1 glycosyltransferase [Lachnospiraceae bacterium]
MEQKEALISIIIPVYNVESYLDRCIESVLKQTYSNIEIILVDDGSTDRCGEICDTYEKRDERIRVVHKENGGLSSARNSGLEIACGEYIGFVDSDDYIAEDMYQTMLKYMQDDVDITCCGRVCLSPLKKQKSYCLGSAEKFSQENALEELILLRKICSSACTKLFRSALFSDISFPVGRVSEDILTVYNLFKKSRNVFHIGEAKYFNCYRKDSISNGVFYARRIDYILFKRDICIDVREHYPRLIRQAEAGYIQGAIYIIRNIQESHERSKYDYIEKRVKKMLWNMMFRGLGNPYLDRGMKTAMLKSVMD